MGTRNTKEHRARLREIMQILRQYEITKGITPEKLTLILENLGPTFIKLGQIMSMHSDVLPKKYCDELMRLRSEVTPMPFLEVAQILEDTYGCVWNKIFLNIEEKALGSASIAQVHRATLKNGEQVVIKVQRPGIYERMIRDIGLLRRIVKFMPPISIKELVDFDMVLNELWSVMREELNFLTEANNLKEFANRNQEVVYVKIPKLYDEYTTAHVLVMEYIEGYGIDDKKALIKNGYDLEEIGEKLVNHYLKQIMSDGFFHADPHSGNVKIYAGKIVWIDMGMMGRLTQRDRELLGKAIRGIAVNDVGMIQDVVLALGQFKTKPDQSLLYQDITNLLSKYASTDIGDINIAEITTDMMGVMKENRIVMPHGLTMLARGLTHMEGVLADISPKINMMEIASRYMSERVLENQDWKKWLKKSGRGIYQSLCKAIDIPTLIAEILQGCIKGQTKINMDLHASTELARLLRRLVRNIVMGLWVMALLISSSIICTTQMQPQIWDIPALGVIGYLIAFGIVMYVFIKHIFSKK